MKIRLLICITIIIIMLSIGCTKETISESTTDYLSETSQQTTTEEAISSETTSEVTENTSEVIETSREVINEPIFVANNLPEVYVSKNSVGEYTISIPSSGIEVNETIEPTPTSSFYDIYRVDSKVVSIVIFCSFDEDAPVWHKTYVFSTSGEQLQLLDIISDVDSFNDYIITNGIENETIDYSNFIWYFDICGLVLIYDGTNNPVFIFIPYERFEGMINTNYIPSESPMYGNFYLQQFSLKFNDSELVYPATDPAWMVINDEEIPYLSIDDETYYPNIPFYIVSEDGRHFLWTYKTNYEPVKENYCVLIEITNGTPEIVATTTDEPDLYDSIYEIPPEILELVGFV